MVKIKSKNMTVVLAGFLCLGMVVFGRCKSPDKYKAGTYRANAAGYGGSIKVEAEFSGASLLSVRVAEETETKDFGILAISALPGRMVEAQTYDIEAVSSATITSEAIKAAVKNCMEQAVITQP